MKTTGLLICGGLLAAAGLWLLWPQHPQDPRPHPVVTAATASAAPPARDVPAAAAESPSMRAFVEGFVERYIAGAEPAAAWLATLRSYVTTDLFAGLEYTDLSRLPAGPVVAVAATADPTVFTVTVSAGSFAVTVVDHEGEPKVSAIEPIRTPAPIGNDL